MKVWEVREKALFGGAIKAKVRAIRSECVPETVYDPNGEYFFKRYFVSEAEARRYASDVEWQSR